MFTVEPIMAYLSALVRRRNTKALFAILIGLLLVFTFFGSNDYYDGSFSEIQEDQARRTHIAVIDKFFRNRQQWTTSNLGSLLFRHGEVPPFFVVPQNRTFTILVWKHWKWLMARHVYGYGSSENDPLRTCSVKNCIFSGEDSRLETADAVVVHLQRGVIPKVEHRNPDQRWIFLTDEAPNNVFTLSSHTVDLKDLADVFNWSMTFRSDADIPVPYGRTVPLLEPIFRHFDTNALTEVIPNWKKKKRDVLVTILISNCSVKSRNYVIEELQKYIAVDVYGKCSKDNKNKYRCPGHFRSDCKPMREYFFYLALENSGCREYLTEKIWYHAYSKGAIPIIMGPSLSDCENLLPPNSFLHIPAMNNTNNIKQLAKDIMKMSQDDRAILSLHAWRNHFNVVNEHGYFRTQSQHLCRVCEAMNYNDEAKKTYTEEDLKKFLDPKTLCKKKI